MCFKNEVSVLTVDRTVTTRYWCGIGICSQSANEVAFMTCHYFIMKESLRLFSSLVCRFDI
jgi:hypothetical protein